MFVIGERAYIESLIMKSNVVVTWLPGIGPNLAHDINNPLVKEDDHGRQGRRRVLQALVVVHAQC